MFSTPETCAEAGSDKPGLAPARRWSIPGRLPRRLLYGLLTAASSLYGIWLMLEVLRGDGLSALELGILFLFAITFTWINLAFWSACFGFVLCMLRLDPISLNRYSSHSASREPVDHLNGQYAVVMPIYEEDPERVCQGLEATINSLSGQAVFDNFSFFLLSDTQNPETSEAEHGAWRRLRRRLGSGGDRLYYRRRKSNANKKVGNIEDFCTRWGARYEGFVVMDADSIMSGETIVELARVLESDDNIGLVQTVPIPIRQRTFFGRFIQFASTLHSPMLAAGQAFWQTNEANYWGHNAIVRTRAFVSSCGIPEQHGKPPFGGPILSHDFVEAALLNRSGWSVYLRADLEGSYEEVPSNLLDYLTRDRRWLQGNIQHLSLLSMRGIRPVSQMHFLCGALAYLCSPLWILMLILSTIDAFQVAYGTPVFFTESYQLFPTWPVAKDHIVVSLLTWTLLLLFLPKGLSLFHALVYRRHAFGGSLRLLLSAVIEMFVAVVLAPLTMVYHAAFVIQVFRGKGVSWGSQPREGRLVTWRESFRCSAIWSIIALFWGGFTAFYLPDFFWWLTPVLFGLILAAPIVRWSSSPELGETLKRSGIFLVPSERLPEAVIRELPTGDSEKVGLTSAGEGSFSLAYESSQVESCPAQVPIIMPRQSFSQNPRVAPKPLRAAFAQEK